MAQEKRVNLWVISPTEPINKSVGWIDTTNRVGDIDRGSWVFKLWQNDGWKTLKTVEVENTYTKEEIDQIVAAIDEEKQDVIVDLDEIREKANNAYSKPEGGIPKSDLSSGVKASLNKADASASAEDLTRVSRRVDRISDVIPSGASSTNQLVTESDVDGIADRVTDIEKLVPAQASESNKLADKAFVNSSVQTATANFRGNWETIDDVPIHASEYPADYAGGHTPTVNDYLVVRDMEDIPEWTYGETYPTGAVVMYQDYAYICIYDDGVGAFTSFLPPDEETDKWQQWMFWEQLEGTWRFKYTGNWDTNGKFGWQPEYQVNEEPFTMAQLAAINSGITSSKVTKLDALPTNAELQQSLEDLTPLVLTYGTSYGEDAYNALEAIATGTTNRKAFIKWGNSIYPASVEDYGGVYGAVAILVGDAVLSSGLYKLSCVIGADGEGYNTEWSYENAETQEVFVATYGVTTREEILAAYNAGRAVICAYGDYLYHLGSVVNNQCYFFAVAGSYIHQIVCSNNWSSGGTFRPEITSSRQTTDPTAADLESTTKYPSMKIMADYVDDKLGDIETLLAAI